MSINRLIALGGRGVKSPVERYIETKGQMERGRLRNVQEQAGLQGMDKNRLAMQATREEMGRAEQAQQIQVLGGLAKGVLQSENPAQAYQQAVAQLPTYGVDTSKIPPEYSDEFRPGLEQMVQMAGMGLDEKFTETYKGGMPVSQRSTKSGRVYAHPEAITKIAQGTPSEHGLTKAQAGSERIAMTDAMEGAVNMVQTAGNVVNTIRANPEATGAPATVAVALDEIGSSVGGIVNLMRPDLNEADKNRLLDPDRYDWGVLEGTSMDTGVIKGAMLNMAYAAAAIKGQTGRGLSDTDLQMQIKELGSVTSNPAKLESTLRAFITRAVRSVRNKVKMRGFDNDQDVLRQLTILESEMEKFEAIGSDEQVGDGTLSPAEYEELNRMRRGFGGF